MDMQKIVTLDGLGVRAEPREHEKKSLKSAMLQVNIAISWVQYLLIVPWGPHRPRISILGLTGFTVRIGLHTLNTD